MMEFNTNRSAALWWLASYPKSGSTWIRLFLNAYVTGWPVALNSPWQYVIGDHNPRIWQATLVKPLTRLTAEEMPLYRPAVLANAINLCPTHDLALKTHHANVQLDDLALIPAGLTKGAILVVRDPRAIAVSFADHMGISIDEAIDRMADNRSTIHAAETPGLEHVLMSWSTHTDSWTVQNCGIRTSVVRYEDLVTDSVRAFQAVLAGFGITEIDPERLEFALDQTRFDRLRACEAESGFAEASRKARGGFFRRGQIEYWIRPGEPPPVQVDDEEFGCTAILDDYGITQEPCEYLTAAQRRRIETNHRESMTRMGYQL